MRGQLGGELELTFLPYAEEEVVEGSIVIVQSVLNSLRVKIMIKGQINHMYMCSIECPCSGILYIHMIMSIYS